MHTLLGFKKSSSGSKPALVCGWQSAKPQVRPILSWQILTFADLLATGCGYTGAYWGPADKLTTISDTFKLRNHHHEESELVSLYERPSKEAVLLPFRKVTSFKDLCSQERLRLLSSTYFLGGAGYGVWAGWAVILFGWGGEWSMNELLNLLPPKRKKKVRADILRLAPHVNFELPPGEKQRAPAPPAPNSSAVVTAPAPPVTSSSLIPAVNYDLPSSSQQVPSEALMADDSAVIWEQLFDVVADYIRVQPETSSNKRKAAFEESSSEAASKASRSMGKRRPPSQLPQDGET